MFSLPAKALVTSNKTDLPLAPDPLLDAEVRLQHTTYDFAKAVERVRQTNYPQAQVFAEKHIRQPPKEEQMLEAFTYAELKQAQHGQEHLLNVKRGNEMRQIRLNQDGIIYKDDAPH